MWAPDVGTWHRQLTSRRAALIATTRWTITNDHCLLTASLAACLPSPASNALPVRLCVSHRKREQSCARTRLLLGVLSMHAWRFEHLCQKQLTVSHAHLPKDLAADLERLSYGLLLERGRVCLVALQLQAAGQQLRRALRGCLHSR